VGNNRDFLIELLEDGPFAAGEAATDYIEANLDRLAKRKPPGGDAALALVAATMVDRPFGALLTGWNSRGACQFPVDVALASGEIIKAVATVTRNGVEVKCGEAISAIDVLSKTENDIRYAADGRAARALYARNSEVIDIDCAGAAGRYLDIALTQAEDGGAGADSVKAPMAGAITSVAVKKGDRVAKGDVVATIEAMKMEHQLKAPRNGVIAEILAKTGDQVAARAMIVTLGAEG
ncbi:MAG: DUF2118 domain-containing protein, partial [Parvularculaceae bacterium]|nr:DUF2118 domain-containing protein [Parvularculaceae bacterium]